jgi:hypothetical protein
VGAPCYVTHLLRHRGAPTEGRPTTLSSTALGLVHHNNRLAFHHGLFVLVETDGLERDDWFVISNLRNRDSCSHRIARVDRCHKLKGLTQIDRAVSRQLSANAGRDQRSAQHTVSYAPAEPSLLRKLVIYVNAVVVTNEIRKMSYVVIRNCFRYCSRISNLEIYQLLPLFIGDLMSDML